MREIASKGQLRASFLRWAIVTVPLILFLGLASGRVVPSGSDNAWYMALAKPELTPPGWLFPVAWSILYILLGLALAVVLNARGSRYRAPAIALFVLQLVGNLAWTPLFFGAQQVFAALILLGAVLLLSIATTFAFARVRKAAAWLMVPYLVWLSFAAALNYGIWELNPNAKTLVPAGSSTQIAF